MRFFLLTIALSFFIINFASAQSKFGIEIKVARYNSSNSGEITDGGNGTFIYTINNEEDLVAYSQSLGVIYNLNDKSALKLHIGNHETGHVLSWSKIEQGASTPYPDVNEIYHYIQLAPSYSYRILNKKISIPVEAGINVNFNTQGPENLIVDINKTNFDYEISTGIDYKIDPFFIIGLHGLYTANINEYQDKETVNGTYKPKQLGLEFSIQYLFGEE
jgi:hypothetical protein